MTEPVLLSLGSNQQPEMHLHRCAKTLRQHFPDIRFSPVYRCPAEGFEGADFLNAAALLHCTMPLPELHALLQGIETAHGRTRTEEKFSDRTLDIDILTYGQCHGEACKPLNLPRPDLLRYPFVLGPVCDLLPDWVHPRSGKTLAEHWQAMQQQPFTLIATDLEL